jgi:CheY-like chemotaxis protein
MVVDDDAIDLELFQKAIETYETTETVLSARDGAEALDLLSCIADEGLPKLILVDYKMPRMDGVDLLNELRNSQRLRHIPTIVLTSSTDHRDIARAYAAGANAYLVKPVEFSEFREHVRITLQFWLLLNLTDPSGLQQAGG